MIAPSRAWPLVLVLACVGWSNARAQELTLTRESEASFRCLMRMTQEGKLGAQIQYANIALMGAQARIELVQHDGSAKVLSLARRRSAGGVSRYFDVEPGEHATAADVALVGRALDECFAEDPFQFAGLEESLAGGPPPDIGAAWRLDGWRGVARAIERRMMALASLEYVVAISIALWAGFVTSVLVVWMTKPSPQHDPEGETNGTQACIDATDVRQTRRRRMRGLLVLLLVAWSSVAGAKVVNVELKFTPFVGDPAKADHVETVAGQAAVFMNNLPVGEQPIGQQEVPVLFDDREIAPSVWIPIESLGPMVHKGKNTIRIEFVPADLKAAYRAQLRWAAVNDEQSEEREDGRVKATNQSDEGVEEKAAMGKVVFERELVADFAEDLPWHHYPPVTAISDADKQQLQVLVKRRAEAFKPAFSGVYEALRGNQKVDGSRVKAAKCLDVAYQAGMRIAVAPAEQMEIVPTGGAAVLVRSKEGPLFAPSDPTTFDKIKGDQAQMCVSMVLFAVYPPQLAVVRAPSGTWEVAY